MKKLYLVDVSSMFFRAFFAIPPFVTTKGLHTNALYGFLSMSIKLLRDIKPDYLAYCFDHKDGSFRYDIYDEYKANRAEMPDNLKPQVPYVRELTRVLGIKDVEVKGYEADDIIGTLTEMGRQAGLEVVIVSGDKDFAQLVRPYVSMYDTMKDVRYDEQGVIDKWGVHPHQMVDYLALVGDSSDNVPGVRGVGPKTAEKLLAEYKTLEGIYEHLGEIKSAKLREKFEACKDLAFLSKRLVTIVKDVPLDLKLEDLTLQPINRENLHKILTELEFTSFERNLFGAPKSTSAAPTKTESTASKAKKERAKSIKPAPTNLVEVTWTLEDIKKNMEPYTDIWAVSLERGVVLGYKNMAVSCDADSRELGRVLGSKFLNWHGFDLKQFWRAIDFEQPLTPAWDHMLAAYVCRPAASESFDELFKKITGTNPPDLAGPKQWYGCQLQVWEPLKAQLKEMEAEKVYREMELPLVPVLYEIERRGIRIDVDELKAQSQALERDIQNLEQRIIELAGETFNISSPKQLAVILFEKLKLPVGKKTKTGFSTSSDVLEKLAAEHPICRYLIEYRELTKLKSTYVDAIPQLVDKKTGRIHTQLRQAATSTGRLSSVNPNLQNIPIRTERGRLIRKAFIPSEGQLLMSADYSQIELRVLAHVTADPGLVRAFENDLDIHAATAAEIYSVPLDQVTPDLRRSAKAVNFGIAYGQGAFGLSESLGISREEASQIIERYFQKFQKVRQYMNDVVEQAKQKGYAETLFGRRRYIDELRSKNQNIRKFGERAAINAPIQGTAADIVKKAMIVLHDELTIPMLLQVHDEILFECPKDEVEEQAQLVKKIMESTTQLIVPLRVNVAWGQNWDDAHS